jgi:ArsR family transcriptional regulator
MKIIKFLMEDDLCVCELVEIMGIAQPTVSQHLRRLKTIGLTEERREGQRINYSLSRGVFQRNLDELSRFLGAANKDIIGMQTEYERYLNIVTNGQVDCDTSGEC